MVMNSRVLKMILCAFFIALTAVLSQVAFLVGPIPFNLATFSVLCAGALLGPKLGAISQGVYLVMGILGLPVFSLMRSGVGVLAGATGGYLIGYVLAPLVIGLLAERFGNNVFKLWSCLLAGFFTYMVCGLCWYMIITGSDPISALMICVVPYLPGDAVKLTIGTILCSRLNRVPAIASLKKAM